MRSCMSQKRSTSSTSPSKPNLPVCVSNLHNILQFFFSTCSWLRQFAMGCIDKCRPASTSSSSPVVAQVEGDSSKEANENFAFDLIETYRQGPQNQDDLSFLLWRLTFPIFTLVLVLALACVGQFGPIVYGVFGCSVWYFTNLVLIVYPYFLIYQFQSLDQKYRSQMWKFFAVFSVLVSCVELIFLLFSYSGSDRTPWLIGNTLFGIIALAAVPSFFCVQSRRIRVDYDCIGTEVISSPTKNNALIAVDKVEISNVSTYDVGTTSDLNCRQLSHLKLNSLKEWENTTSIYSPPACRRNSLDFDDSNYLSPDQNDPNVSEFCETDRFINRTSSEKKYWIRFLAPKHSTNVLYISGLSVIFVWILNWAYYLSPLELHSQVHYWWWVYLLAPIIVGVLLFEKRKSFGHSFEYLIFYGVVVVHIPNLLGHLSLYLFSFAESEIDKSDTDKNVSSYIKFSISVLFLVLMQGYFYLLVRVVENMSEPMRHPSLMYIAQLYYYMFWYLLVSNDEPIDGLYWGMLLINNIHIVLTNTGLYKDLMSCRFVDCADLPHNFCIGPTGIACYRMCTPSMQLLISRKSKNNSVTEECHIPIGSLTTGTSASRLSACCSMHRKKDDCDGLCHGQSTATKSSTPNLNSENANEERPSDKLRPLYFLMKMAEQDNMADTSALVLVPTVSTILALFDERSKGFSAIFDRTNLWYRCILMFAGRICGSHLAQRIFAHKLKSKTGRELKENNSNIEQHKTNRLFIQQIMLQDFQRQFWYLTVVTIVCTFACFEKVEWPIRFAFIRSH